MNSSQKPPSETITDLWKRNSEIIRIFLERQPSFKQLAGEVSYTIEKKLKEKNIKYAAVTFREKNREFSRKNIQKKIQQSIIRNN